MMRVGIAHLEYSHKGGIERASAELADRFAQGGNEVHYHACDWQTSTPSPVIFHRVPTFPWPHSARLASFAWAASRQLRARQYDITHSHGSVAGCDIVTAHSCHLAALRATADSRTRGVGAPWNWGIADSIRLSLEKQNYRAEGCRKVIAVAGGVRRELMKSYGLSDEDIVVIPNGVDIRAFSPDVRLQKAADARASLGFVDADEVILFVGNEFHRKGLRCAIDALALGTPRQKLLVVGNADPAEYSQYAHRVGVQSRLRFTGSCTDMPAMYAAADLFLLPSSYEAFPLSLLEAAASGLALLATRVNGVEETIQHGDNGFFVTQEPAVIAAKIQQILENPELHRHMEAEARKTSLRYSWDNIMAETCTVYEAVLREKRNGMRHGHHRR